MFRLFYIALLCLTSSCVCAEEYYWTLWQPYPEAKYPSVKAACAALHAYGFSNFTPYGDNPAMYAYWPNYGAHMCQFVYVSDSGSWGRDFYEAPAKLKSDTCPEGKVLNYEKGGCFIEGLQTPEECLENQGQVVFEIEKGESTNACLLGCHVQSALAVCGNSACTKQPVQYTGNYCEGEDYDKPPSLGVPNAPDNPDNPNKPDTPKDPNSTGGNSGNGGSGNEGAGSDSGNNSANESNSGSGEGSGGNSSSGNGTGSGKGSGGDSGNGKNGSGGNSKGECKEGEPCEEGKSKVSGEDCDTNLVCEGDAIQCAILKRQKQQACEWREDAKKEGILRDDLEGLSQSEKEAFEKNSTEIPVSNLFNDALNKGRWLPANCPTPKAVTVMGRTLYFDYAPLCKFAEWLSPLIVLLASLFFAVTVAKAVKGD